MHHTFPSVISVVLCFPKLYHHKNSHLLVLLFIARINYFLAENTTTIKYFFYLQMRFIVF